MLKRVLVAFALFALLTSPASAASCPKLMKKFDAALAKNPSLPADQLAKAKELRAKGEALHNEAGKSMRPAGIHEEAARALREALAMLGDK